MSIMLKAVVIVVIIRPKNLLEKLLSELSFTNFHICRHVTRELDFHVCVRNVHEGLESCDFIVGAILADDPFVIAHVLIAAAAKWLF